MNIKCDEGTREELCALCALDGQENTMESTYDQELIDKSVEADYLSIKHN